MDLDFVLVAENDGDSPTELPMESDGTLLLSTVEAQFPGASGIKFINPKSGAPRGVRLADGKFHPPDQNEGFGDRVYFCVFPKTGSEKRKLEEEPEVQIKEEPAPKVVKKIVPKTSDLIVLGIPWETTDASLKSYFEDNFGEVVMAQVKTNRSGKSRGFGFVRFSDYEVQKKALSCRHQIDGRYCDVSLPPSAKMGSSKVFVGRLTSDILVEDLREYFSTLGEVTDCFIPKPFRGFGFVTFMDPAVAKIACQMGQHEVKNIQVHVETASPKPNPLQPGPKQANGRQGGIRDRVPDRRRPTANRWDDEEDDWYGGHGGHGGRGGERYERGGDINRSPWNKGPAGYGGGREEGFGEAASTGINLRGVSPDRLINAIKDAGLASALGLAAGGGGGYGSSSRGGFADDGFDRYRSAPSGRYDADPPASTNSWKGSYDRYGGR